MEIYIQSRGFSKGYCWLDEAQEVVSNPPSLQYSSQLIDASSFAIVLRQFEEKLSLLITGLEAENRQDNHNRKIRNSVLFIGYYSEEVSLRSIIIQALQGELTTKVDYAISSVKNAQGFQVNFSKLKTIFSESFMAQEKPNLNLKIGNLSELQEQLIQELQKYSLPQQDNIEFLVVASSTISKELLEEIAVWRGLSETIKSEDDWIENTVSDSRQPNLFDKLNSFFSSSNYSNYIGVNLFTILMIILLVSSVGLNVWFWAKLNEIPNKKETLQKLEQKLENKRNIKQQLSEDITNLKNKEVSLTDQINKEKREIRDYKNLINDLDKMLQDLQNNYQKLQNQYPQLN